MQTPTPRPRAFKRFATLLTAFVAVAALTVTFFYINGRSANVVYYSRGSLAPNLTASWSTTRDGLGLPPADFVSGDIFVIQNTHNMATAAAWSVSGANSKIQIESGGTLTAANPVTLATTTTFQIDDGGTYVHNYNTASPSTPAATIFQGTESFANSSTFEIRNWINNSTAIPVATGGFGNLTINVATLAGSWNQTGNLTNVKGNLTIQATGGAANEFRLVANSPTTTTLTIGGDLNISGGTFNLSSGTAVPTVNLGGNYNQTGGTFTQSGANAGTVNFSNGASFVSFTKSAGTLNAANINWSIAPGKTVQFNNAFTNAASRTFNINSGGILLAAATITNNGTMTVNGDFRLTDGGFADGTGAFNYGANGILSFTTSNGYTVEGTHVYWPTTSGPQNVNVIFGGITLNAARTVGGLFQYSSGVAGAGNLTLNGTSQINAGGFLNGSPTYGASSLLKYNTGGNYGRNGEWLPGATGGAGYPANVQLSGNTTLDLPNGSTGSPFQLGGTLTIDNGSTLNMAGGTPLTQPLNVLGNLNLNGNLTLSTAGGGDLRLGGNWTRAAAGTFAPNGRAVIFNGVSTQVLTVTGGGTESFAYLVIDKPSGNLTQNNAAGFETNIDVKATVGNVLSIVNAGGLDLNGRQFSLSGGNGGNVFVSGGARFIGSTTTSSFFNFNNSKTVASASGGTLSFGNNLSVNLSAPVDFGASLTTINGLLVIQSGGAVNTNAPTYGAGSSLLYATGGPYARGAEWTATTVSTFPSPGYPDIVNVGNTGTILDMGANGGTGTQFAANGTLSISPGATFTMAQTPMTVPITIKGDVSNNGTLILSTALGGDIKTHGSFIRFTSGVFTHNDRAVFFEGGHVQQITDLSGTATIPYIVIDKSGGNVNLNATDLVALAPAGGSALSFQTVNSHLAVGARTLTVGGTFGSTPVGGGLITSPASSLVFVDGGTPGDMGTLPTFNIPSLTNLTVNRTGAAGSITLSDASVSGTLALTAGKLKLSVESTTLSLGNTATVTRGTGYVLGGIVQKSFGVNPDFTFPVGTDNGYSPVEANSTTGAGTLSVSVKQQALAVVSPVNSLQRYWSLSGSDITTNLTFNYLDGDVNVNAPLTEADYKIVKFNSTTPTTPPSQTVDAANNKAAVNGVSSFSDWTLAADSAVYGQLEFTLANTSVVEGDSGSQAANVVVRRAGGGGRGAVSIDYAITDGTATAGSDYTATDGTLNWAADDFEDKQITININGDTAHEPDETVNLTLSNPQGGAVAGSPVAATLTILNDDSAAPAAVVYVDDDWAGLSAGTDPDGAGPATSIGYDAFATIQGGINGVAPDGTVNVASGTYDEDVNVNKTLSLLGAGAGTTNIRGLIGGAATTVFVTASNATVAGFTITRLGNNTTDWNNSGLNSIGVAMQGQAVTGALIRDNVITGNRTGIDINNSNGHTVRNNVIDFNRTGFIFRNRTDNMTVVENFITNNWTVGVLFLDASGGSNIPAQSAAHSTFSNNNISANWYGQIVDRQSGGSLPAPATTNYKNFIGNWYGTTSPVVTTANSTEPGYAAQIPVAYGGSAVPPGGQPDLAGSASANIKYTPFLLSGTDTNVETTPGRGTHGFQGVTNSIVVSPPNQNGWAFFDDAGVGVGTGGFEEGPATPPLGTGSAFLQVDDTARHALGTAAYAGTRFDDLSELQYGSYQTTNTNPVYAPSLQFDIDYDLTDTNNPYQGRLVFEPYQSGTVQQNVWQQWDTLAGNWYGTRATVPVGNANVPNPCQQATPCTRQQILASFPNAGIRNTPASLLLFKAGGPWPPNFRGNVDALKLSVGSAHVTYDFEPTPQLSVNDVTLAEGDSGTTSFTFTVSLSRASDQTVTVDYATADDTATVVDNDYTAVTTTQLSFAPGETSKQLTVLVNGDTVFEPNEQFFVNLSNASASAGILDGQGVGAITNDDGAPAISINDVTVAEPEAAGTSNATFTVSLSNASAAPISVDYQTVDGTAAAPGDYNAVASTTLIFAPGQTGKPVTVTVNADALAEGTETFGVNLSNPTGGATIDDGTGTGTITDPTVAGQALISEFRFRGPTYNAGGGVDGSRDEYIELYNNTNDPITVGASDGSGGWSVAAIASDGETVVPLATIPAGTIIPARGHYLVAYSETPVNPATGGYSLGGYAVPDLLYSDAHITDGAGVALFRTADEENFNAANRLDAAGFDTHVAASADLFREGAGLVSPGANDGEYAFVRKLTNGLPQDTGDNAADFTFVSTDGGLYGGVQSILGAPGPEDSGRPVQRNGAIKASLIEPTAASTAPPNRVRSGQIQPGVPNAFGTLSIQRRFKNTTAETVTRLRFRVVDITTLSSPVASSPQADLRVLSSTGLVTDSQGAEVITVTGLTLETPPAQANGGGLNSTLTVVLPGNALAAGNSIDVQFLLGVQQQGNFRFLVNVEALPGLTNPSSSSPDQSNMKQTGTKTTAGRKSR